MAERLLGTRLVRKSPEGRVVGRIVETEAYVGPGDRGAHTFGGRRTARTEVQYGPAGHAYVFQVYGLYYCLCVVTAVVGCPEVVLIRAVEPEEGFAIMARRRGLPADEEPPDLRLLTTGPGRLCQAFGITKADLGSDLTGSGSLFLAQEASQAGGASADAGPWLRQGEKAATTPRINIDYAAEAASWPWRFIIAGSRFVSR